jgi:SRSO17 transposase
MSEDWQERFTAYVEALAEVIRHADRAEPLRDYCRGLLLPGERKSVEPIAAITAPARVSAKHQSLLHFVANAPWSNERVLRARLRMSARGRMGIARTLHRVDVDERTSPASGRV